jgi:hypothetical protein
MLQTLLCDIDDDEVLDVISDLCRMVQRSEDDYQRHSLFNFLQHLMTAYRQPSPYIHTGDSSWERGWKAPASRIL